MRRTNHLNFEGPPITALQGSTYRIPTVTPESDGTLEWEATTLVLAEAHASDKTGVGFSYADAATARIINDKLTDIVIDLDALSVGYCWEAMVAAIRNQGRPGICSMAIAAVDNALWDLNAQTLGMPLVSLLGQVRAAVPVYGSGGFTSYSITSLREQLAGWVDQGIMRIKMKAGREPEHDMSRVAARAKPSDRRPSCLSMPTALIRANRLWQWLKHSQKWACHGSKSQSPVMTWKD